MNITCTSNKKNTKNFSILIILHLWSCPLLPFSFSSLRPSRALHCRGWSSHPHPRQLPPRVLMAQTATPLSTPLPLRHLLSLFPPLPPSMPPLLPLALVTRSANWTLWTEWEHLACLQNVWLHFSPHLLLACGCQPVHKLFPASFLFPPIVVINNNYYLFSLCGFEWFPPTKQMGFENFCENKQPWRPIWLACSETQM